MDLEQAVETLERHADAAALWGSRGANDAWWRRERGARRGELAQALGVLLRSAGPAPLDAPAPLSIPTQPR